MKKINANITVNNKRYSYSLEDRGRGVVFVECIAANIKQKFLAEDVAKLLLDLPNLIIAEKKFTDTQSEIIRFRISSRDKKRIEKKAVIEGYDSLSDYMRNLVS